MSHQINDKDESLSEVNVIPLADLSLVLLIILMVLSPLASQALIQISAAKAAAALTQQDLPREKPETPVIVSFSPGILKLNGALMGSDLEFVKRLDEVMQRHRDKSVILTAAPQLAHGQVVRLMDVVKKHGAETLILVKWDTKAEANQGAAAGGRS